LRLILFIGSFLVAERDDDVLRQAVAAASVPNFRW